MDDSRFICEGCGAVYAELEHKLREEFRSRTEAAEVKVKELEKWLTYIVLAVCDPRESVNGNVLSYGKAVEQIIDRLQAAEAQVKLCKETLTTIRIKIQETGTALQCRGYLLQLIDSVLSNISEFAALQPKKADEK